MLPNDDNYLYATFHLTLIPHTHSLISSMFLGAPSSSQNASDAGNDLDSLANIDLRDLDLGPSVSSEFVASPHFVDIL